jgi:hypothetical protein
MPIDSKMPGEPRRMRRAILRPRRHSGGALRICFHSVLRKRSIEPRVASNGSTLSIGEARNKWGNEPITRSCLLHDQLIRFRVAGNGSIRRTLAYGSKGRGVLVDPGGEFIHYARSTAILRAAADSEQFSSHLAIANHAANLDYIQRGRTLLERDVNFERSSLCHLGPAIWIGDTC